MFSPTIATIQSDQVLFDQSKFDKVYAECTRLLVQEKLDASARLASATDGAAAAGATAVVGGAAAAAVAGYSGLAVAAATIVLLPVAAIAGAIGISKRKRGKKERAIKTKVACCLAENGYVVTEWTKASKPTR